MSVQNVIEAWHSIKDNRLRKEAIDQLNLLYESAELEKEITSDSQDMQKILGEDKRHPSSHQIICGSINDPTTARPFYGKVDLVFTSPPYNAGIDYDLWEDDLSLEDYKQFLYDSFDRCDAILNDGGRIVINIRDIILGSGERYPIIYPLYEMFRDWGYAYRGTHIWYKGREESSTAWGTFQKSTQPSIIDLFEYVLVFQKGKYVSGLDNLRKTEFIESVMGVWKIRPVKKINQNKENTCGHPCPFPVELAKRVIKLYSCVGDTVLDPFAGIMSTSCAAIETGRNSISVELSDQYCKTGLNRINHEYRDLIRIEESVEVISDI